MGNKTGPFALASRLAHSGHIAVHPADRQLNPPESYLYIQDGLIIMSGIFWILAYFFYSIRCYRDKRSAYPLHCVCAFLPWEIYYAIVKASNTFEHISFLGWAAADLCYCVVLIMHGSQGCQWRTAQAIFFSTIGYILVLRGLNLYLIDDIDLTAFLTGFVCQIGLSWVSVWDVAFQQDLRGHSMEIWVVRFLGTVFACAVLFWRYLNVPQNWEYVGSWWSIIIYGAWLLGDIAYPFAYYSAKKRKIKVA